MPSTGSLSSSLAGTSGAQGNALFGQSQNIQNALTPFFQNEMYNPQGMGATTLSQIMTNEGQSAAGALGGARQGAMDMGARTGNLAAIPQLIGGANRAGITQMSDLAGNLGVQNANLRQQQVQQGAAGLSGIMGQDLGATFQAEGQENEAIKNLQAADDNSFGHTLTQSLAKNLASAPAAFAM